MGPPLQETGDFPVHVVGDAGLTNAETSQIETWKAELEDEKRPRSRASQYTARPPVRWDELHAERPDAEAVINKNTRVVRYRRFSCAGLVIDCYRSADINILELNDGLLPDVSLADLCRAYALAGNPARRSEMGLPGPGPFKVVLPGYLIHALKRSLTAIRQTAYIALPGNHSFP